MREDSHGFIFSATHSVFLNDNVIESKRADRPFYSGIHLVESLRKFTHFIEPNEIYARGNPRFLPIVLSWINLTPTRIIFWCVPRDTKIPLISTCNTDTWIAVEFKSMEYNSVDMDSQEISVIQ